MYNTSFLKCVSFSKNYVYMYLTIIVFFVILLSKNEEMSDKHFEDKQHILNLTSKYSQFFLRIRRCQKEKVMNTKGLQKLKIFKFFCTDTNKKMYIIIENGSNFKRINLFLTKDNILSKCHNGNFEFEYDINQYFFVVYKFLSVPSL